MIEVIAGEVDDVMDRWKIDDINKEISLYLDVAHHFRESIMNFNDLRRVEIKKIISVNLKSTLTLSLALKITHKFSNEIVIMEG